MPTTTTPSSADRHRARKARLRHASKLAVLPIAAVLASSVPASAGAQDVVVFRRPIAAPARGLPTPVPTSAPTQTPSPDPIPTSSPTPGVPTPVPSATPTSPAPTPSPSNSASAGTWSYGDWTFTVGAPTCSDAAPQERTATCMRNGQTVADALCTAPREPLTRDDARYDGCKVDWATGDYGAWSPSCGENSVRTRPVQCLRTGGDAAPFQLPDASCTGTRPSDRDPGEATAGCTYTPVYGQPAACSPEAPGSTKGHQEAAVTACNGTGPDGATNPVGVGKCPAAPSVTACTLTYSATYGTFGTCSNGFQTAPVQSCTMRGSDGSSSTVANSLCEPQKKACYTGTWVKDTTLTTGVCTSGSREQYYAVRCMTGATETPNACDPATKPSNDSRTLSCQSSCGSLRSGYYYSPQNYIGQVTGADTTAKVAAGKLLCEGQKPSGSLGYYCTVLPGSGSSANVYTSPASGSFISSNGYWTASCTSN